MKIVCKIPGILVKGLIAAGSFGVGAVFGCYKILDYSVKRATDGKDSMAKMIFRELGEVDDDEENN